MDEDWVSIIEAAKRLTDAGAPVDRSTLSRYLDKHADALPRRREGKQTLVEFGALVQHRGENIRIDAPVPARAARAVAAAVPGRFTGSRSDGAARKANAEAEIREMDLAERRRQLTPVGEVDQAGRDAIALMQSAFERAVEAEAASQSVRYGWDERTLRLVLKSFARRGLDVFHREVLEKLDAVRRHRDAGDAPAERSAFSPAGSLQ